MITQNSYLPHHCTPQKLLPRLLRLGILKNLPCPALLPVALKNLSIAYPPEQEIPAMQTLEFWALQLLQAAPQRIQIALYNPAIQDAFHTIDSLHTIGHPAIVRLTNTHALESTLTEWIQEAHTRQTQLAHQNMPDWASLIDHHPTGTLAPLRILLLADLLPLLGGVLLGNPHNNTLLQLLRQGERLGLLVWHILPDNLTDYLSDHEKYRVQSFLNALKAKCTIFQLKNQLLSSDMKTEPFLTYTRWGGIIPECIEAPARAQIIASYEQQQAAAPKDFFHLPIGESKGKPIFFRLGAITENYHALLAGTTGTGKSLFLKDLLLNACETYSPNHLKIFLGDYKDGIDFVEFEGLGHIEALSWDKNTALHLIRQIQTLRETRAIQLREARVPNIETYNQRHEPPMPRILLVMDEVQSLFEDSALFAQQIGKALEALTKQGRVFGIHVLLASQNFRQVGTNMERGQLGLRMSFQVDTRDCMTIMDHDNDAPSKLKQRELLYNDDHGRARSNVVVRVPTLNPEQLTARLMKLKLRYPALAPTTAVSPPRIVSPPNIPSQTDRFSVSLPPLPEDHATVIPEWSKKT